MTINEVIKINKDKISILERAKQPKIGWFSVYTPQEIERGKRSPVSFVSTVLREGKTLYVRGDGDSETVAGQGQ